MIIIKLSQEEREELKTHRKSRHSNIGERCFYVLLSAKGKRVKQIARQLGRNKHTIRTWLKAYQDFGIDGLKGSKPPGRPNKKEKKVSSMLSDIMSYSPSDFGYQEEAWTIDLLVDYFKNQNIELSASTVKRALKSNGYVYKRFAKTVPKDAPTSEEKKARVEKIVNEIKEEEKKMMLK